MPRNAFVAVGALALAAVAGAVGCGSSNRVQAGLANAPSMSRFTRTDPQAPRDPVTNGGESCARNATGSTPLRGRLPPCPHVETAGTAASPFGGTLRAFDESPHAPWLPAAMPLDSCVGSTVESWQLPTSADAVREMCERACAPSIVRCVSGRGRRP